MVTRLDVGACRSLDHAVKSEPRSVIGRSSNSSVQVVPRSPATCPRRLLLVKPVTAPTTMDKAPARAMARPTPKRSAPVLWPSLAFGWWMRSKSAEPMAQP